MNDAVVDAAGGFLHKVSERYPGATIAMSLTGAGTAVLSLLKVVSIVGGACGAVFSAIAGFYAMRSAFRKSRAEKKSQI